MGFGVHLSVASLHDHHLDRDVAALGYGLGVRYRVLSRVGVDLSFLGFMKGVVGGEVQRTDVPIQLSAVVYAIPHGPLQLYGAIGAGVAGHETKYSELENLDRYWTPAWSAGGGAKLWWGSGCWIDISLRIIAMPESGRDRLAARVMMPQQPTDANVSSMVIVSVLNGD